MRRHPPVSAMQPPRPECFASCPSRTKCSAVVYADRAALERLPNMMAPPPARRRALTVMLHERHREPDKLDAPARCAGTTSLSGQPIAERVAPEQEPRPIGPRKECPAAKCRCVLAGCRSSWPRHPSTLRLSRLPQPPSRRTPRHFAVAPCGCRRRSRPQNVVPYF